MQDPTTGGTPGYAPIVPPSPPLVQHSDAPNFGDKAEGTGEPAQAAQSLAGQARQRLTGTLDNQKGAAADFVAELAQSVQRSGEQFAGRQDWIASAIGRGAAELNTLADSLRDTDLRQLLGKVQSFARQQPALFMGAALAGGFAVARVGKLVARDLSRDDLPTVPEVGDGQR